MDVAAVATTTATAEPAAAAAAAATNTASSPVRRLPTRTPPGRGQLPHTPPPPRLLRRLPRGRLLKSPRWRRGEEGGGGLPRGKAKQEAEAAAAAATKAEPMEEGDAAFRLEARCQICPCHLLSRRSERTRRCHYRRSVARWRWPRQPPRHEPRCFRRSCARRFEACCCPVAAAAPPAATAAATVTTPAAAASPAAGSAPVAGPASSGAAAAAATTAATALCG